MGFTVHSSSKEHVCESNEDSRQGHDDDGQLLQDVQVNVEEVEGVSPRLPNSLRVVHPVKRAELTISLRHASDRNVESTSIPVERVVGNNEN